MSSSPTEIWDLWEVFQGKDVEKSRLSMRDNIYRDMLDKPIEWASQNMLYASPEQADL